ncbi:ubinuclein-1 [Gastrophryne carolinensis]
MAEPRRVQLSSVPSSAPFPPNAPKRPRLEDPESEAPVAATVRIALSLFEPDQKKCPEFFYPELLRNVQGGRKKSPPGEEKKPFSPFDDEEAERKEVEMLAKKFEEKYANKKKKRDRMQDLIDMGYGYDESDSFIDNSEAYDELVPASLTTKYGGFYINSGTLQFRQASESEDESVKEKKNKTPKKMKERGDKIKKKKREEEKKGKKNKHPKPGFSPLNGAKDKKKKKADLNVSELLARFQREKEAEKIKSAAASVAPVPKPPPTASVALPPPPPREAEPAPDPLLSAIISETDLLQAASAIDSLTEKDLENLFDLPPEKGSGGSAPAPAEEPVKKTPSMPNGLTPPLEKRIKELSKAVRASEGDKKTILFTQEMNTALLDIYILSRELSSTLRSTVFSHLSSVLPCSKDTLVKWASRLYLHKQQGGRLREPLRKLKDSIAKEMPEQMRKYNEEFKVYNEAKHAKMLADDKDKEQKALSEEEEEEDKSSKKPVGPRKKFQWTEEIRQLLGQLVRMKVDMFEPESSGGLLSLEEYFKSFLDVELKPLWPRGWMQARTLFNESRRLYPQLSSIMSKNKSTATSKVKLKASSNKAEKTPSAASGVVQTATLSAKNSLVSVPPVILPSAVAPSGSGFNQDNSLDGDLLRNPPSLDAVSEHLDALSNRTSNIAFDFTSPKPSVIERLPEDKKKVSPVVSVVTTSHPLSRPPVFIERPSAMSVEKKQPAQGVITKNISEIHQKPQQPLPAKPVKIPQVTNPALQPLVKLYPVNPQHGKGSFTAPSQSGGPKVSTPSPPQRPPTPQTKSPKQHAFPSQPPNMSNHHKPVVSPGLLGKPISNGGQVGHQVFRPPIPKHTVLPPSSSGNTSGPYNPSCVNQTSVSLQRNLSAVPAKKPTHPSQKLTLMTPQDCGKGTQGVAKLLTSAMIAGKAGSQSGLNQSLKCNPSTGLITPSPSSSSSSSSSQSLTVISPNYKPNGGKVPTPTSLGLMSTIHSFPLHVIYTPDTQKSVVTKDAIVTGPAPGTFAHGLPRKLQVRPLIFGLWRIRQRNSSKGSR